MADNPFTSNPFAEPESGGGSTRSQVEDDRLSQGFEWETKFRTDVITQVEKWADALGVSKFSLDAWVRDNIDGAINFINQRVPEINRQVNKDFEEGILSLEARSTPVTAQTWEKVWNHGLYWFSAQLGAPLFDLPASGRGRGGSRGPTAADIRNQFDEDQLTDAVNDLWRAYMWEESPNARAIAQEFINTVVSTLGQQEVDFETFVKGKMRATTRWDTLYQNKPDGVDELQYVQSYARAALSAVGGAAGSQQEVSDLVAGGAALGASPDAFGQRLSRTDAVRNSTGFVTGLEDRLSEVNGVLRG